MHMTTSSVSVLRL